MFTGVSWYKASVTLSGDEDTCEIQKESNENVYGMFILKEGSSTVIEAINVLKNSYTLRASKYGTGTYNIYTLVSAETGINAYSINHVKNIDVFSVTQKGMRACINSDDRAYSSGDIEYWLGVTQYGEIVKVYK
mgnify:CR=1 FL=1